MRAHRRHDKPIDTLTRHLAHSVVIEEVWRVSGNETKHQNVKEANKQAGRSPKGTHFFCSSADRTSLSPASSPLRNEISRQVPKHENAKENHDWRCHDYS